MRALLTGRRHASLGVVLGLLGVLCLLAATLGSTLYVYDSLHDFRSAAYERCLARLKYDAASNDLRRVEAAEWRRLGTLTSASQAFTDEEKTARDDAYQRLADAADRAVAAQVGGNCNAYRP